MKELYREYFFVPEDGKVREKVMMSRITVAVVLIIACLIAMSMTAYAFFTHNETFVNNVITGGNFEADVLVTYKDEGGNTVELTLTDGSEERSKTAYLLPEVIYTVTVSANEESTAQTGFCVITAEGSEMTYHTQQIGVDGDKVTDSISFTVRVSSATAVKICSHWGTSSYYDAYKNNESVDELYIVNGAQVAVAVYSNGELKDDDTVGGQSADTTGASDTGATPETGAPQQTEKPADTTASQQAEKPADTTAAETTAKPADTKAPETTPTTEAVTEETTAVTEDVNEPVEEVTTAPAETVAE